MFEKGSYLIYGTTGICKIIDVTALDIGSVPKDRLYYVLRPCSQNGNQIYTPVEHQKLPLRPCMSRAEAEQLILEIPKIEGIWEMSDKLWEQECKKAIRSCDPREWVRIIKTCYMRQQERLGQGKKITAVDERYFHEAELHLYSELAISLEKPPEQIKDAIKEQLIFYD